MASLDELMAERERRRQSANVTNGGDGGGTPMDQLLAEKERRQVNSPDRLMKAAGSGTRRGTEGLVGGPADVAGLAGKGIRWLTDKAARLAAPLTGADPDETMREYDQGLGDSKEWIDKGLKAAGTESIRENVTDPLIGKDTFKPRSIVEKGVQSVFEAGPGAALSPTGLLGKASQAVATGVGADVGEYATKGTRFEPYGRAAGGIGGSLLAPGALYGTRGGSGNPDYDRQVGELDAMGVPLSAGQRLNSRGLRYAESELGGGTFDAMLEAQKQRYTDSLMNQIGLPGRRATPENLAAARQQIGGTMDQLGAASSARMDPQLQTDLADAVANLEKVGANPAAIESARRELYHLIDQSHTNGGIISGEAYQNFSTTLRTMAESGADPATGIALQRMREGLDDAVERSMGPETLDAWREARRQYRGLSTIEAAMGGRGKDAAGFDIAPGALRGAISGREGATSVAEGRNELVEPANAGMTVLSDRPNSGTAARQAVRAAPVAAAGLAVGGQNPLYAAALAAPWLAGKALMSRDVQAMMAPGPRLRALMAEAMAASGATAGQR